LDHCRHGGRRDGARIAVARPELDLSKTVAWKDAIVGRLTGGVSGLLKRAKVKIVHGWAQFRDGKTVAVETELGLQVIRAEQVVIATGSVPSNCRSCPSAGR
jgi:dihydrolipoamide dehydrogenase